MFRPLCSGLAGDLCHAREIKRVEEVVNVVVLKKAINACLSVCYNSSY